MTALAVHDEPQFRDAAEAKAHYRRVSARLRAPVAIPVAPAVPDESLAGLVVGPSNRMAVETARRVLKGDLPGPLYVFGPPGTGKTALARALAQAGLPVAEDIDRRSRLRDAEALVTARTVLTASCPPARLLRHEARTMCLSAVVVPLLRFDERHALAVCRHQLGQIRAVEPTFDPAPEIIDAIGAAAADGHISASVLKALLARHWAGEAPTRAAVAECLAAHVDIPSQAILIRSIQEVVARRLGSSVDEMLSQRRAQATVLPRHIAMALAKRMTQRSLPEVGRQFRRDHTSVMHAVLRIESLERAEPEMRELLASLEHEIREAASPRVRIREDRP